jgi:hypothetical protein
MLRSDFAKKFLIQYNCFQRVILCKCIDHLRLLKNISKGLKEIEFIMKTIQLQLANYRKLILIRFCTRDLLAKFGELHQKKTTTASP